MRKKLVALCLFGSILVSVACSSSSDNGSAKACVPGASIACVGAGGCSGGQACKSDGSGYDACVCGQTGADASTDGSHPGDSGTGADGDSGVSGDGGMNDAPSDAPSDAPADAPADGPACHPGSVSTFQPPAYPPARRQQGACTAAQIDGFFTDCLDGSSTQQTCSPYVGTAATQANKTCAACIVSKSTDATLGPVVERGATIELNKAGCVEMMQGNATCATAMHTSDACQFAACGANCPVTDTASYQAYETCMAQAAAGGCQQYASAAASCANAAASSGPATVCFQGATFRDNYNSLVPIFCGP